MSKPRVYGMLAGYTPNHKMDMRHRKKAYQRQRELTERAAQRKERMDVKSETLRSP